MSESNDSQCCSNIPVVSKRHYKTWYDHYEVALPNEMSHPIRFIKNYFRELYSNFSYVPKHLRYYGSEFDYFDIAIETLKQVRESIKYNNSLHLGSLHISPVTWASFGVNGNKNVLSKIHFTTLKSIVCHYKQFITFKRFSTFSIPRNSELLIGRDDPLDFLAKILDESKMTMICVAILFLNDVIRNVGPDCEALDFIFTNSANESDTLRFNAWYKVYKKCVVGTYNNNYFDKVKAFVPDPSLYTYNTHIAHEKYSPEYRQHMQGVMDDYFSKVYYDVCIEECIERNKSLQAAEITYPAICAVQDIPKLGYTPTTSNKLSDIETDEVDEMDRHLRSILLENKSLLTDDERSNPYDDPSYSYLKEW